MKYLLLLAILVLGYVAWRNARLREAGDRAAQRPPGPPALPQDMVRCPVCSVHLPRGEALAGASGRLYCTHEHRASGGN
ncbi:MAG: PP0621 family protein [Ramlibacter sp.]